MLELDAGICAVDVRNDAGVGLANARLRITSNDELYRTWLLSPTELRVLLERDAPIPGQFEAVLVPGSYTVHVACLGFEERRYGNVVISAGRRTSLEVRLDSKH